MREGPLRKTRKARIAELDYRLEREPDDIETRSERAGLLREEGLFEAAKHDYLELLRRKPGDFGVLNDFGALVLKAGYSSAARSLFGEAVQRHPQNPMGHVNLANLLLLEEKHEEARGHFEAALRIDAGHIHAHRGMANVLAEIGDAAGARRHRDCGFRNDFVTALPFRGDDVPIRVLLLISAVGGNTPTGSLLDESVFQVTAVATEYYDDKIPLPPHDLVFNSIGDADICTEALEAACRILRRTRRPVINDPRAVLKTGRASNAERFRNLPNVVAPRMVRLPRRRLVGPAAAATAAGAGFAFPLLARVPGFHTGRHFVRAETAEQLAAAVEQFPADDAWLIEHLDARDGEGFYRKARVMIVDRKLYPLHLAISRDWKVHYYTADMAESADRRAEEARFLDDMAGEIGPPGMAALDQITRILDLDYGGIDFALNARGDILFFEANATMIMVPLLPDPKWHYRHAAFDAVFAAVRTMLTERATRLDRCVAAANQR